MSRTEPPEPPSLARRTFVVTIVALSVIVAAVALWKLRIVVGLLFLAFTIAAAMRPGIDGLARHRVPRSVGVLLHYLVLLGLIALFLSFVVPHLVSQVQAAIAAPTHHHPHGVKEQILSAVEKRLRGLPTGTGVVHTAVSAGKKAVEVAVGIFFTFASAAYWVFERDRAVDVVARLVARPKRKKLRDTWSLIDAKLGAFVRGQLLLIAFVAVVVSAAFWLIGEPYWLLLGIASGILEVIPVIGPLAAVVLAVAAGLTHDWHTALFAAVALVGVRLLEDYLVTPRVLGGAVGLSPLVVLVSVSALGILLGGFYVLLAIPFAAVVATVLDVTVFGAEPAEAQTPAVLFTAKEAE